MRDDDRAQRWMSGCRPVVGRAVTATAVASLLIGLAGPGPATAQTVEWPSYAADTAGTKYTPVDQINAATVDRLAIAWRQSVIPDAIRNGETLGAPVAAQNTPLMADGRLYVSTGLGTVAALDPTSGAVIWDDGEPVFEAEGASQRTRQTRGVAYWTDGAESRVIAVRGPKLLSIDARTGLRDPAFGEGGTVDLRKGLIRDYPGYYWNSAPLVVNEVVIVGSYIRDILDNQMPATKEAPRGDVRGFDVRTGEQIWTFHTIPIEGQPGIETWGIDPDSDQPSWVYSGSTNMWAHPTADPERGLAYLPLSTPSNDYYGGHRPGDNLYAESLVCVDVATGELQWYFQAVHHGVWDYDFASSPNLVDITVGGREIAAVAIPSKQGFTYVFDRVTGEPVWPIEERPVPPSPVPGEQLAPTQPFPTKPPPFESQGVRADDLIDFTPEMRAEALELLQDYRWGSLFEPPILRDESPGGLLGTIQNPGTAGGANWQGAGVDPSTGVMYVTSAFSQNILGLTPSDHPRSDVRYTRERQRPAPSIDGLSLFKPPYGRLTAIDLSAGEILWQVANGPGPRDHPRLRGLDLPWLGSHGRAAVLVTPDLIFLGEGTNTGVGLLPRLYGGPGGKMFRAYDKTTGAVVWEMELPGGTSSAPMSYFVDGRQYIVVAVGWDDMPSEWFAFTLP